MMLAIYVRDESGLIEFKGWQDWDNAAQFLEYFFLDDDAPQAERLVGWPTNGVQWHRHVGIGTDGCSAVVP